MNLQQFIIPSLWLTFESESSVHYLAEISENKSGIALFVAMSKMTTKMITN